MCGRASTRESERAALLLCHVLDPRVRLRIRELVDATADGCSVARRDGAHRELADRGIRVSEQPQQDPVGQLSGQTSRRRGGSDPHLEARHRCRSEDRLMRQGVVDPAERVDGACREPALVVLQERGEGGYVVAAEPLVRRVVAFDRAELVTQLGG